DLPTTRDDSSRPVDTNVSTQKISRLISTRHVIMTYCLTDFLLRNDLQQVRQQDWRRQDQRQVEPESYAPTETMTPHLFEAF
ncbi:MAG TPA: hypothetical protein VK054_09960, partial [Beutenbergiaceae bacterium]|nr:hypothetical protein [Beutenbergiaceae bacterium]